MTRFALEAETRATRLSGGSRCRRPLSPRAKSRLSIISNFGPSDLLAPMPQQRGEIITAISFVVQLPREDLDTAVRPVRPHVAGDRAESELFDPPPRREPRADDGIPIAPPADVIRLAHQLPGTAPERAVDTA